MDRNKIKVPVIKQDVFKAEPVNHESLLIDLPQISREKGAALKVALH